MYILHIPVSLSLSLSLSLPPSLTHTHSPSLSLSLSLDVAPCVSVSHYKQMKRSSGAHGFWLRRTKPSPSFSNGLSSYVSVSSPLWFEVQVVLMMLSLQLQNAAWGSHASLYGSFLQGCGEEQEDEDGVNGCGRG